MVQVRSPRFRPGDGRHPARRPSSRRCTSTVALAHRAVRLSPAVNRRLPAPHLDHHRHPAPPMGGRAPQAPRPHRRGGRPALTPACSASCRCSSATSRSTGAAAKNRVTVAKLRRATCSPDRWDRLLFDHALLGLGIGIVLLVRGPRAVARADRRPWSTPSPTWLLSAAVNAVGHTFGRRPHANNARNLAVAGLAHRRRGTSQQPPRRPHVGPPLGRPAARSTPAGG